MNLPNLLTVFRLLLIPVFIQVFYSGGAHALLWSLGVFLLAGATDLLDGYIARRYDLTTELGTLLDPLADKLMLVTVLGCLSAGGYIPFWIAAVVMLKEGMMIVAGLLLYLSKHKVVIPANHFGKAATAAFYLAVILISVSNGGLLGRWALYGAVALTVAAMINYKVLAWNRVRKRP